MVKERLRQVGRVTGFLGLTAGMLPVYLAHMKKTAEDERGTVHDLWVRRWANALLALFGIEVVVEGRVPPPTRVGKGERGRLVVANHRSVIDIGVLLSTFGGALVSRADVSGWPVIGPAARAAGTVFVDRSNAKSGAATIRALERALSEGRTVGIFPEGTTFDGDEVRPFHGGAFVAAARAEAEILPVGLAYPKSSGAAFVNETFTNHLARMAKSGATRMVLAVGEPFLAERGTKASKLAERAHREVAELVVKARARCGP